MSSVCQSSSHFLGVKNIMIPVTHRIPCVFEQIILVDLVFEKVRKGQISSEAGKMLKCQINSLGECLISLSKFPMSGAVKLSLTNDYTYWVHVTWGEPEVILSGPEMITVFFYSSVLILARSCWCIFHTHSHHTSCGFWVWKWNNIDIFSLEGSALLYCFVN